MLGIAETGMMISTARNQGLVVHADVTARHAGTGIQTRGILTLIGPLDDEAHTTVRLRFPGLGRLRIDGTLHRAPLPHPDGGLRATFRSDEEGTLQLEFRIHTLHDGSRVLHGDGRLVLAADRTTLHLDGTAVPL